MWTRVLAHPPAAMGPEVAGHGLEASRETFGEVRAPPGSRRSVRPGVRRQEWASTAARGCTRTCAGQLIVKINRGDPRQPSRSKGRRTRVQGRFVAGFQENQLERACEGRRQDVDDGAELRQLGSASK